LQHILHDPLFQEKGKAWNPNTERRYGRYQAAIERSKGNSQRRIKP